MQCMHIGSYDEEAATIEKIERYIEENGFANDISDARRHHEIYLGDRARATPPNAEQSSGYPCAKRPHKRLPYVKIGI